MANALRTIYRHDYRPPPVRVETVDLRIELGVDSTRVQARLDCAVSADGSPVRLDARGLDLESVAVDGRTLDPGAYRIEDDSVWLPPLPANCVIETVSRIDPDNNTALEGLYRSGGIYCTQCEAEGFRRITPFPDRPDVMAVYSVTLIADPVRCPILLANGNPVGSGVLDDGRHWVRWHDPFPKPSYLFAMVAGDLACHEESYTTAGGRPVLLQIYTEHHNAGKTGHAMASLKAAMRWDEQRYGLEYDLDRYMIVAVDDFNMGAMENKGLNVFNTNCVLADPRASTDRDFDLVEAVIAHEYFHNWTGNRVTCRDWFQLSLKEGLTVYREQQFCEDMHARDVERIQQVRALRASQFPEDAGPMAHPVRPDAYVEISNFYTPTIYNKGAEVIRMYASLLGEAGFRRGMDLYFQRHDGQAVTCDDFLAAMADANNADLTRFSRWYSQAGTPLLSVHEHHDPDQARYTLDIEQSCPDTPGQTDKQPFHLPLRFGLLAEDGSAIGLKAGPDNRFQAGDEGPTDVLVSLRERRTRLVVDGLTRRPVVSLLRGFSAPVRLELDQDPAALGLLLAHDSDGFARWEAGQRFATRQLLAAIRATMSAGPGALEPVASPLFITAFQGLLLRADEDPAFTAEAMTIPGLAVLADQLDAVDVDIIHTVRERFLDELLAALEPMLLAVYERHHAPSDQRDAVSVGRRALANRALGFLARGSDGPELFRAHLRSARNMTDELQALTLAVEHDVDPELAAALVGFHARWRTDPLVLNKWFSVQAMASRFETPERVRTLLEHPDFSLRNPNRVRALIAAFATGNPLRFHRADGAGYRLLADAVLQLDRINPQVAARILLPLTRWRRHTGDRPQLMRRQLERIEKAPMLSKDVAEVASKGLAE